MYKWEVLCDPLQMPHGDTRYLIEQFKENSSLPVKHISRKLNYLCWNVGRHEIHGLHVGENYINFWVVMSSYFMNLLTSLRSGKQSV